MLIMLAVGVQVGHSCLRPTVARPAKVRPIAPTPIR